jgi:hypothetical protein
MALDRTLVANSHKGDGILSEEKPRSPTLGKRGFWWFR